MAKIGLTSPWARYYMELEAFFGEDPDVKVLFSEDKISITLYVDGEKKAAAIRKLLPAQVTFGEIVLKVNVVPSNELSGRGFAEIETPEYGVAANLFAYALEGNPILSYIKHVRGIFMDGITYVVFRNKVVQYYNDNIGDVNGLCSTLYQDIAKNLFGDTDMVFFCTDIACPAVDGGCTNLGRPLGEWP